MSAPSISPIKQIDITTLNPSLRQLITAYHDALRFVEQQPFSVGKFSVDVAKVQKEDLNEFANSSSPFKKVNHNQQWVVPAFARLFIEAHIHNRLSLIVRQLNIEKLAITVEADDRQASISHIVEQLETSQALLFNWGRLRTAVVSSPAPPILFALFATVTSVWLGLNISSINEFIKSSSALFQTGQGHLVIGILVIFFLLFILTYMAFSFTILPFGFRFKRAIFSGGRTQAQLFSNLGRRSYEFHIWALPTPNIYQLEREVFQLLGAKKPKEFPIDFVLDITPYLLFVIAIWATVQLISILQSGAAASLWLYVLVMIFWFSIIFIFLSGRHEYQVRKEMRDL